MSRIVVYTAGTLGDHLPFVALGSALRERGHQVAMAINQAMHPYARGADLEIVPLTDIERGPEQARARARDWNHWDVGTAAETPDPAVGRERILAQARELAEACRGADLLLATSIRIQGFLAARAARIPWLTLSMNPFSFFQPESAEERQLQRDAEIESYRALRECVALAWRELGVARAVPAWSNGWHFAPHVLLASSVHFSRPNTGQLQPRHSLDLTGFWFYEDPAWEGWVPDPALEAFCNRRPLVLAFSSQPLEDPRRILGLHVEAAAKVGVPLLVQRGWAGFSEEDLPAGTDRDAVFFADFLPHDWLFARAACTIQHGGAGSIARALRRGCPLLIEPFGNDQLYNASRVHHLGAGAVMHPFRMTAESLAQALRELVLTPECRRRASEIGVRLGKEDGLAKAGELIGAFLSDPEVDDGRPLWRVPALAERRTRMPLATRGCPGPAPVNPAGAGAARIPQIVHQVRLVGSLPESVFAWGRSWTEHNPGWEHRLWTEEECLGLVRAHYDWFLPVYANLPDAASRFIAARFLILHRCGGVFADANLECLRALEPLVSARSLLVGVEPDLNLGPGTDGANARRAFSTGLLASVEGHPFWEHLTRELAARGATPVPADLLTPAAFTRAVETYPSRAQIHLEPSETLFPRTLDESWEAIPAVERDLIVATAFTMNHWLGGWWRQAGFTPPAQMRVELAALEQGRTTGKRALTTGELLSRFPRGEAALPLVSCLMVTRDRPDLARRAVRCFAAQTYPCRELVIVDNGEDRTLEQWVGGLGSQRIRLRRVPSAGTSLGELRNISVGLAEGDYLAQWDDDDLSDPLRLEVQMAALREVGAQSCLLERELVWWPEQRRMAISFRRSWENSFVVARLSLPPFPPLARGEDTPVIEQLVAKNRVALLDAPWLYTYVFHGGNTWSSPHWVEHWRLASEAFTGTAYAMMTGRLGERLNLAEDAPDDLRPLAWRTARS